MADWSDAFKALVHLTDINTISAIPIRTSVPIAPWTTSRITLLGDAIHSMTPFRGIGANVALRDAVRLRDALVAAHDGERDVIKAIQAYEAEMIRHGFAAVETSRRAMEQTLARSAVKRAMSRAVFRVVNKVPPLKRWMFRRQGDE